MGEGEDRERGGMKREREGEKNVRGDRERGEL